MPVAAAYLNIKTVDGLTLYAVLRQRSTLNYANTFTNSLEGFASGHWYSSGSNNYAIAGSKVVMSTNVSADYQFTFPGIPAGVYFAEVYRQVGATPALTDGQPSWVIEDILWNGTALLPSVNASGNEVVDVGSLPDADLTDDAITDITSALAGQSLIVISPVGKGSIEIVAGDAYLNADGRSLDFTKPTGSNWPTDLTLWTITLYAEATTNNPNTTGTALLTKAGSVLTPTGTQVVRVELATTDTTGLRLGQGNTGWKFALVATKAGDQATLVKGTMSVLEQIDGV